MCTQSQCDAFLILFSIGGVGVLNIIGVIYIVGLIYGHQNLFTLFVGFGIFVLEIIIILIAFYCGRKLYKKCQKYDTIEPSYFSNI